MPPQWWLAARLPHMLQKEVARNFTGAQRRQMPCVLLAIDECDALLSAQTHQRGQRNLGSIGLVREHGFAKHCPAYSHAIQPAHQMAIDPGFHAVGMACGMECGVSLDNAGNNPGAVLAGAGLEEAWEADAVSDLLRGTELLWHSSTEWEPLSH